MNIGILTYYGVHNHGAVLQANALKNVLEQQGHNVSFLRFDRNYDYIEQEQTKKYKISLASVRFYGRYLMQKGIGNILFNLKKRRVLKEYRAKCFRFTGRYCDFAGDTIVIGSDEVFSIEIGLNPCLFGHGLRVDRVLSYAASFGPTSQMMIREAGCVELIASGLKKMSSVAVRDNNSMSIVKELADIDATLVCDPVILYGYEREIEEYVPQDDKYVVVYAYDKNLNDPKETTRIVDYAHSKGWQVCSVGYHHNWCDRNVAATPNELLGWINHAQLVFTDTFHGSVLSIICNTPMIVKLRGNENKLHFLLSEYGLLERVVHGFDGIGAVAEKTIDFEKVNRIIQERRKVSMDYLVKALRS